MFFIQRSQYLPLLHFLLVRIFIMFFSLLVFPICFLSLFFLCVSLILHPLLGGVLALVFIRLDMGFHSLEYLEHEVWKGKNRIIDFWKFQTCNICMHVFPVVIIAKTLFKFCVFRDLIKGKSLFLGFDYDLFFQGLHRLGKSDVAVYDGSWTEWGAQSDTPVDIS